MPVTRVFHRPAISAPVPPVAFAYGPSEEVAQFQQGSELVWPANVYMVSQPELYGPWFGIGSVLVSNGACLTAEELYQGEDTYRRMKALQKCTPLHSNALRRRVEGTAVLIATQGHQTYGHWLIDFLPKIHLLRLAGFDPDRLTYLLPTNLDPTGFAVERLREMMDLVGLGPDRLVEYDPSWYVMRPDELIVPTLLRRHSRMAPEFAEAIAVINERIDATGKIACADKPRIFVSRQRFGRYGRQLINTLEVERLADERGFEIIHPQHLPLSDQIALFRGAREIVGQYGSALHNSIFSSAGTKVCGLQGTGPASAQFAQSSIGERLGQPTGYVFGPGVSEPPLVKFEIDLADLTDCLDHEFP